MANISLAQLQQMFDGMRTQSGWDTDGDLLWGYFFTDEDDEKLQRLAEKLAEMGHRVVDIYPTDDETTNFLHVERVEAHDPASLHRRNEEMEALADEFGVASYDGMDVGPAP